MGMGGSYREIDRPKRIVNTERFDEAWHPGEAVGLFMSMAGLLGTWNKGPEFGPKWYPIALVVTTVPCLWTGGKLAGSKPAVAAVERP
jgi:hypothetical protein